MRPDVFIPAVLCFLVAAAASIIVANKVGLKWAVVVLAAGTIFGFIFPWQLFTG